MEKSEIPSLLLACFLHFLHESRTQLTQKKKVYPSRRAVDDTHLSPRLTPKALRALAAPIGPILPSLPVASGATTTVAASAGVATAPILTGGPAVTGSDVALLHGSGLQAFTESATNTGAEGFNFGDGGTSGGVGEGGFGGSEGFCDAGVPFDDFTGEWPASWQPLPRQRRSSSDPAPAPLHGLHGNFGSLHVLHGLHGSQGQHGGSGVATTSLEPLRIVDPGQPPPSPWSPQFGLAEVTPEALDFGIGLDPLRSNQTERRTTTSRNH